MVRGFNTEGPLAVGGFSFKTRIKKRKKAAFIWVADSSRNVGHDLVAVKGMLKDMNAELIETVVSVDSERGTEARRRGELLERDSAPAEGLLKSRRPDSIPCMGWRARDGV